ncbi:hypothetical protein N5J43_20235 [Pseudomonas nicosulfuronedens]|uniref:Uncharacterized protein n=1 Tax=Pseudomonas nicosulfuronedens TaxID=2571105 RepID=A0A5R9QVB5_9PSED|nr:hypothetical protein [Pseudomonas nicosulfuronedens]MDH1011188.1 hypothetical protein [Pseudomonas nicosulfuronedens]MDH1981291.1 hypothetical protein [Pseudomonas nicosulfuronedens]MDH2029243.1 hypothetical protein [Pseudomonas nicosulfuronedens]TLX73806.1 hypothetical protein FAS41_19995 [Pseudomonas nicosulfuronedens]
MEQNPYAAPKVELVDQSAPGAFLAGRWSSGRLRLLAGLSLALLLCNLVLFVLSFAAALQESSTWQRYELWVGVLSTVLGCFLLWRTRHFLEDRFSARGLGWPVGLSIAIALVMQTYSLVFDDQLSGEFNGALMGFMGLFVPTGIVTLWYGIRLLKIELPYPSVKIMGWLEVTSGVCLLSVLLFLPGTALAMASLLPLALMFLRAARELEAAAG